MDRQFLFNCYCALFYFTPLILFVCAEVNSILKSNTQSQDIYSYLEDDNKFPPIDSEKCIQSYKCHHGEEHMNKLLDGQKSCFCDAKCSIYGDCCAGITGDNIQKQFHKLSSCKQWNSPIIEYSIYTIDKCPATSKDDDLKEQCENQEDDVFYNTPVTERNLHFVFKNIFCALCNGYTQDKVSFWSVNLTCYHRGQNSDAEDISDIIHKSNTLDSLNDVPEIMKKALFCQKEYRPPPDSPPPRQCVSAIHKCSADWRNHSYRRKCKHKPASYVYFHDKVYHNKYCADCNHLSQDAMTCVHPKKVPQNRFAYSFQVTSISIMLDFNNNKLIINNKENELKSCPEGFIYEFTQSMCRPITCQEGYDLQDDECVQVNSGMSSKLRTCQKIMYNASEFNFLNETKDVYMKSSGDLYTLDQYFRIGDKVYVCIKPYGSVHENSNVEGMISFVGQLISIAALIFLVVIYLTTKSLQTIPGKCILFLAAFLVLAQVSFIIGMLVREVYSACYIFAVVIHYTFLASFFWMNVMAFDVWHTFNKQFQAIASKNTKQKFNLYTAYAIGTPLLLVLIALIIDQTTSEDNIMNLRYGRHFCWINNNAALLYFFALPLFFILVANFLMFSLSIYHIHKSHLDAKQATGSKKGTVKTRIILYAKLSTITGLTWIIGYAASLTQSKVLWYTFDIFNSLQGLLIAISFLWNKKFTAAAKHRYNSLRYSRSNSSRSSSTSKTYLRSLSKTSVKSQVAVKTPEISQEKYSFPSSSTEKTSEIFV